MLCLAKRDIAPWGAVICLVTEAFFFAKKFLIFSAHPKNGRFFVYVVQGLRARHPESSTQDHTYKGEKVCYPIFREEIRSLSLPAAEGKKTQKIY